MSWKNYLAMILISAAILGLAAAYQAAPGYMDAEYYYAMGFRIAKYKEFSEPFIWNYLSGASVIPQPGFTYWMPLPALLAAAGMWICGSYAFGAAKIGAILIAALVPALTMSISFRLSKNRLGAWLAGGLAVFPAFYSVFLTTTDSFGLMMFLGGAYLWLTLRDDSLINYILLGALTGLIHLTRVDGLLWIAAGLWLVWKTKSSKRDLAAGLFLGYLLTMGPWFARNWTVLGNILPSASSRTLWLSNYDELFLFNTQSLNVSHWISSGIGNILGNIGAAVWSNTKTLIFVQGQLVLFPFILLGLRNTWKVEGVKAILLVWFLTFVLMGLVFPFAGMRGGYFHSGAGFQPLFWVLAVSGFLEVIQIGVVKRGWEPRKAQALFGASLVVVLTLSAGFLYANRVVGSDPQQPVWNASSRAARNIDAKLTTLGINDLVLINNPPGLYAATGRSSIVIPSGGISELLQAAAAFNVHYLVLEPNHPQSLNALYQDPGLNKYLEFITSQEEVLFFKVLKD